MATNMLYLSLPDSANHINAIAVNKEILFFQERDGPFVPTLRLLHKCTIIFVITTCDTTSLVQVLSL